MSKKINLTKGKHSIVSDQDYDFVIRIGRWCYSNSGYAVHYYPEEGKHKTLYMHRAIMQPPADLQVDHINRDRLDNRRQNLRLATRSENQANKSIGRNNTSGYKGVTLEQGKYAPRIRYYGLRIRLGRYCDPVEAAMIYDCASRLLYHEFAGLNFPDQLPPPHIVKKVQKILAKHPVG
jgi:hypothetical protein